MHSVSVIKTSQLMLYREIIAVCSQIHTKHKNTLCGQNVELYIKTQSVPRSKHSVSVIKTSQLMLYREIIAVCSEIHTNTVCGQNVELLNVKCMVHIVPTGLQRAEQEIRVLCFGHRPTGSLKRRVTS